MSFRTALISGAILLSTASAGMAGEKIKPEMIVQFAQGGVACLEKAHLMEITLHAMRGEATKTNAMLVQNGGDCVMLSSEKRYKVLSAEYNNPDVDFGLLEIVGEDKVILHGAWAYSVGAEQVAARSGSKK